jgi:hypothetical protein
MSVQPTVNQHRKTRFPVVPHFAETILRNGHACVVGPLRFASITLGKAVTVIAPFSVGAQNSPVIWFDHTLVACWSVEANLVHKDFLHASDQ